MLARLTAIFGLATLSVIPAHARTICTIVADAQSGIVLLEEGDCATRTTPASTFKIALSLIGFDANILADEHAPAWPFRVGYPDWGGDAWRQHTDPAHWMTYSVVWYSQQIAQQLGADRFASAVRALDYGNADVSGDPGQNNGLERSWIASSLAISPREQVAFLSRMLSGDLPVSAHAVTMTRNIVQTTTVDDWRVSGKTGAAYPRKADGSFDRAHGWGWFVGWAQNAGRDLVFARLTQDEGGETGSAGLRTRDRFLTDWPKLVDPNAN